jgi:glycerate 2-kinase
MLNFAEYRRHVDELFLAALNAAEPGAAVERFIERGGHFVQIGEVRFDLDRGRLLIVSVGKAAAAMAEAALKRIGEEYCTAFVISKKGANEPAARAQMAFPHARWMVGNHPVSGADSIRSTRAVTEQLAGLTENDLLLCLISGGASALLTQPAVSLSDWQMLTNALLASGCTINELNTVRRQLDQVKGGGLARMAAPAPCVSLILSDVVGNPLKAIGSGPTVPVDEDPEEALRILERYKIAPAIGDAAYERISDALVEQDRVELSGPAAGEIHIVGDVRQAAEAARARAEALGFAAQLVTVHLEGEAREVGRVAAAIAKDAAADSCLILGGETTVTLRGDGIGGRNLETALAAAIALKEWPLTAIASLATDGEDGPTPAAGAVVAGWTAPAAESFGLSPEAYLNKNDSFSFFERLDETTGGQDLDERFFPPCLVISGSTGTNVNDLLLILTYEQMNETR